MKDVSFKLRKGEILGLFGVVGSGRTETARVVFGLAKKDHGTIKVKGKEIDITSPSVAVSNRIGFVTEDRRGEGLSLVSSVKWNITLPFINRISSKMKLLKHQNEQKVTQALSDKLRIKTPTLETKVENLSGGNQQKIVIAKWLGAESEILIFDEPTRGIDVGAKNEIYHLMEDLVKEGKAIIMISSELPELMALSDRIMVFHDGLITAELTDVQNLTEEEILHYAVIRQEEE